MGGFREALFVKWDGLGERSFASANDAHHTTPTSKSSSSGTPVSDDEAVAKMRHPALCWADLVLA